LLDFCLTLLLANLKVGGRIIKANLSWSRTRAKFYKWIASFLWFYLHLNWQNSNLRSLSLTFSSKKKDMNKDKLAINWKNFAIEYDFSSSLLL